MITNIIQFPTFRCWPEWCLKAALTEAKYGTDPKVTIEQLTGEYTVAQGIVYRQFVNKHKNIIIKLANKGIEP